MKKKSSQKEKILILGGGIAGLSTAFSITNNPYWKEKYEVDIIQMGWRLGGKCASSRNKNCNGRIEEHGIHIFGNFYHNAMKMVWDAYKETDWKTAPDHIRSIDDVFIGDDFGLLLEYHNGKWLQWPNPLPRPLSDEKPWDNKPFLDEKGFLNELIQQFLIVLTGKPILNNLDSYFDNTTYKDFKSWAHSSIYKILDSFTKELIEISSNSLKFGEFTIILKKIEEIHNTIKNNLYPLISWNTYLRRLFFQLDFYSTVIKGLIKDQILTKGINSVDSENYRDWLTRHGLSKETLNSPLPQLTINICFQYPEGNSNSVPKMSASSWLMFLLRQLTGKGSWIYRFASGTGETVISPLYQCLKERGVNFHFFHKIKELELDESGHSIAKVKIEIQDRIKQGMGEYNPVDIIDGWYTWPSEPKFEYLEHGDEIKSKNIDLESYWADWRGVEESVLVQGKDFDKVVLALSIGAIPIIGETLIHSKVNSDRDNKWQGMIENVKTTQTQAFQIWIKKTKEDLGWKEDLYTQGNNFILGGSWIYPTTDYIDMTELIKQEKWEKGNEPKLLLYFCGPMEEDSSIPSFDDKDYPNRAKERVLWTAVQSLRATIGASLFDKAGNDLNPWGFEFENLAVAKDLENTRGVHRMKHQYIRANIDPTERYVLSIPGSAKFRLKAWESGFENLILAGDWIWTGINVGSVEGTVISGFLAGYAITGSPNPESIPGYKFLDS